MNLSEYILVITVIIGIMIVATIGIIKSESRNEQVTCTIRNLTNSSFIVCTYKNKILYSGEVKDED